MTKEMVFGVMPMAKAAPRNMPAIKNYSTYSSNPNLKKRKMENRRPLKPKKSFKITLTPEQSKIFRENMGRINERTKELHKKFEDKLDRLKIWASEQG